VSLATKPESCRDCPAYKSGKGFVKPTGHTSADFVIVGSGPGEDDVYQGVSGFDGSYTGASVTRRLYTAGLQRSDVMFTELVWCWMPNPNAKGAYAGNREPTRKEVKHCWNAHLGPWFADLPVTSKPKHIITLGLPALRWLKSFNADTPAEVHYGTTELQLLPPMETPDE